MNPLGMTLLLVVTLGAFAWTGRRRWLLLRVGPADLRFDRLGERVGRTLRFAFGQARMPRYKAAGAAHVLIFAGFLVLLLRSLILFGRAYSDDPTFGYWIFDGGPSGTSLGHFYSLVKDVFVVLVLVGTCVFFYYRLVVQPKRMSLSVEALVILGIIFVMMLADVLYDGAHMVLHDWPASVWEPLGSALAGPMRGWSAGMLTFCEHLGFWTHTSLVLVFLNLLPRSKHFHVITAVPNVFFAPLDPPGRLPKMDDLEGMVEREETLGIKRIDQFGHKAVLDFYTCTECGRCTDFCPANRTGKLLSPKQFTIDLRNFLYKNESALIASGQGESDDKPHRADLV
ncbi:MAG: (Fe-S)-binding protein, partial [Phycisphaerae bacterium]